MCLPHCNVVMRGHYFYGTCNPFRHDDSFKYGTKVTISNWVLFLIFSHWNTFQYQFYITFWLNKFLQLNLFNFQLTEKKKPVWSSKNICKVCHKILNGANFIKKFIILIPQTNQIKFVLITIVLFKNYT